MDGYAPSSGSTHHVGCSSIRYSLDWDLAYVSSPRNLVWSINVVLVPGMLADLLMRRVFIQNSGLDEPLDVWDGIFSPDQLEYTGGVKQTFICLRHYID